MHVIFSFSFLFISVSMGILSMLMMGYSGYVVDFCSPFSSYDLSLSFSFDYVSVIYFCVVSLITSVVFMYSGFYMNSSMGDESSNNSRFFLLLMLFVVSMFFLVFSSSWVTVMLGWDGLGLVSFLLVIYYNNASSLDSGLITVFSNRVGDCLFILSFAFIFYCGWGTIEFLQYETVLFFCLVIVFGAITKSAQLPFSSWLPAAMAAPTPVSSLVHSSTLVTAGVFLLIRFNCLLEEVFPVLIVISLGTMLLAGVSANLELDFKKIVAMSTLSQLGFMLFSLSMGFWEICYFHMVFHAFFKSTLFLSTGSLMHLVLGDQDSRNFGSFSDSFLSKMFFSASCLSLMGFPFTMGFYSKDYLLGTLTFSYSSSVCLVFLISCGFTVSYSLRLLYLGFLGNPTFSTTLSYSEGLSFYLPVMLLYTSCVCLGNFFSFNFFPPSVFSFWDLAMGSVVMSLGLLLFFTEVKSFYWKNFFMTLGFLSSVSASGVSSLLRLLTWKKEYTWGEFLGGKGVSLLYSKFNSTSALYNHYTFSSVMMVVLLIIMMYIC
uniref:NADH:ubiquinone reductase (H(+)-translocating) n=1 Tax=Lepidoglyphus destructor TaxID=36936 RepID=A0A8F2WBD1_LEPDS|nr:NADH dehydrogenase subunit 5 [Lepidoglyphus destructor]